MFARTKKSGKYEYLQIVENHREGSKVNQRVIATLGRLDQMHAKGDIETLVPLPGSIFRESPAHPLRKERHHRRVRVDRPSPHL